MKTTVIEASELAHDCSTRRNDLRSEAHGMLILVAMLLFPVCCFLGLQETQPEQCGGDWDDGEPIRLSLFFPDAPGKQGEVPARGRTPANEPHAEVSVHAYTQECTHTDNHALLSTVNFIQVLICSPTSCRVYVLICHLISWRISPSFCVTEIPLGSYQINITNFVSVEHLGYSVICFKHSSHNVNFVVQLGYSHLCWTF